MRIAYVNNHYQLGGAETVVRQLHEGALAAGHDSRLHVSDGRDWPRARGLRPLYPRLLARLDHSRLRPLVARLAPRQRWTDRAFRALARGDADLVHVHSFHGLYASIQSFAALARAKPLLWTFHRFWGITGGCDHPFACTRYQEGCGACPQVGRFAVGPVDSTAEEWSRKQRVLAPLPLRIVSPSHHLARRVRESTLGHAWTVDVIPNGVDPAAFRGTRKGEPGLRRELGLAPDKTVALFVCRDFRDPIKGFPVLERALASRPWPGLQLALAGGDSAWAAARLAGRLEIADLGYLRDRARLARLYESADLFLYASDGENFPCVVLEAMASECLVVTTPVDGVTEQVEDNVSGLVAADLGGDALAARLAAALGLPPATRRALGAAARRRVETEFSEQGMIDAHLALYVRLVAPSQQGLTAPINLQVR
jgi:glycosyltransferase involved in cell wall biosynthesis